jgi:hypothetical protein
MTLANEIRKTGIMLSVCIGYISYVAISSRVKSEECIRKLQMEVDILKSKIEKKEGL